MNIVNIAGIHYSQLREGNTVRIVRRHRAAVAPTGVLADITHITKCTHYDENGNCLHYGFSKCPTGGNVYDAKTENPRRYISLCLYGFTLNSIPVRMEAQCEFE